MPSRRGRDRSRRKCRATWTRLCSRRWSVIRRVVTLRRPSWPTTSSVTWPASRSRPGVWASLSGWAVGAGGTLWYTLRGQDWHIFKALELMDKQSGGFLLMVSCHLVEAIVDGRLELLEGIKPGGVQGLLADESPQAFDEVEVWRVGGQEQQADSQFLRQRLHQHAALIRGIVQHHRNGHPQAGGRQGSQQRANRRGRDVPLVAHPDHVVRDRVERPQDVVTLAPCGRTHEHASQAPEGTQERGPDEVRRIDEEHSSAAGTGFLEGWFQVLSSDGPRV